MSATEFRRALDRLGWSGPEAARQLGVAHRQRVSEWATGRRAIPPYIARHVETLLALQRCQKRRA